MFLVCVSGPKCSGRGLEPDAPLRALILEDKAGTPGMEACAMLLRELAHQPLICIPPTPREDPWITSCRWEGCHRGLHSWASATSIGSLSWAILKDGCSGIFLHLFPLQHLPKGSNGQRIPSGQDLILQQELLFPGPHSCLCFRVDSAEGQAGVAWCNKAKW